MAVRPLKGTTLTAGQRFDLYVFPIADQEYTLNLRYYVLLNDLTTARPYPYGGMTHAETILAGVRAAGLPLAKHILAEVAEFDPARPDAVASFVIPASPQATALKPDGS